MYRLIPDAATVDQVAALPVEALSAYADVLAVLELKPWAGEPQHAAHPDGAMRRWIFDPHGAGQIIHLIVEDRREVHLLMVQWLD